MVENLPLSGKMEAILALVRRCVGGVAHGGLKKQSCGVALHATSRRLCQCYLSNRWRRCPRFWLRRTVGWAIQTLMFRYHDFGTGCLILPHISSNLNSLKVGLFSLWHVLHHFSITALSLKSVIPAAIDLALSFMMAMFL